MIQSSTGDRAFSDTLGSFLTSTLCCCTICYWTACLIGFSSQPLYPNGLPHEKAITSSEPLLNHHFLHPKVLYKGRFWYLIIEHVNIQTWAHPFWALFSTSSNHKVSWRQPKFQLKVVVTALHFAVLPSQQDSTTSFWNRCWELLLVVQGYQCCQPAQPHIHLISSRCHSHRCRIFSRNAVNSSFMDVYPAVPWFRGFSYLESLAKLTAALYSVQLFSCLSATSPGNVHSMKLIGSIKNRQTLPYELLNISSPPPWLYMHQPSLAKPCMPFQLSWRFSSRSNRSLLLFSCQEEPFSTAQRVIATALPIQSERKLPWPKKFLWDR